MEKRLEGCEAELRGKEDELFLQLERSLRIEEEVEKAKNDRVSCIAARDRLDRQREVALRRLQMQLAQNEITRQTLERARQDIVRQATVIRAERDALEREVKPHFTLNVQLWHATARGCCVSILIYLFVCLFV